MVRWIRKSGTISMTRPLIAALLILLGQAELRTRVAIAASSLCRPGWMTKRPDSEFAVRYNQEIYRACVGRVIDRALAGLAAG